MLPTQESFLYYQGAWLKWFQAAMIQHELDCQLHHHRSDRVAEVEPVAPEAWAASWLVVPPIVAMKLPQLILPQQQLPDDAD